jgi:Lon-like ATP-dependent protease
MEMQDLGTKLRMVVMSHRRISLLRKHDEVTDQKEPELSVDPAPSVETPPPKPEVPVEGVLLVETENLVHDPFETTDEVKALTQEIIKTIRDIIVSHHRNFNLKNLLFCELIKNRII